MIRKLTVSICLLFSLFSFAQEGTSSPYSFYGIGDVRFKGTAETRAMGGLMIFPDSIHINLQNPASYASLKYTTFSVGGSYSTTKLKTETQKENARRTTMDYFAVGLPLGKFGAGFGLIPFSSVGYKIQAESMIDDVTSYRKFTGTGGVNKAFLGMGYKITPNLSIGVDVSYNFGKIETSSLQAVESVQFGSREMNNSDITGASFNAGLSYSAKLTEKLQLFSALTYSPESNLNLKNGRRVSTVQFTPVGGEIEVDFEVIDVANTTLKMPSKLTVGVGVGELRKWVVGGEVTLQQSKNQQNRFLDIDNAMFENAIKYTLGGYYIPNYNSFTSYFEKITYRAGLRFENTGLILQNKSIQDAGVTLGMGLPLGGTFSNMNIGFEYGKRGTVYGGLVEENYANISIGLSLNDRWFVKRKYD